jgi:hypothetical protein
MIHEVSKFCYISCTCYGYLGDSGVILYPVIILITMAYISINLIRLLIEGIIMFLFMQFPINLHLFQFIF